MAHKGKARVLYFINDTVPTDDQRKEADEMGPGVSFRNARHVKDTDPLEHADIVAGEVPEIYRRAYANPSAYANAFSRGAPVSPGTHTQAETDVLSDVQRAENAKAVETADEARRQRERDAAARSEAKADAKRAAEKAKAGTAADPEHSSADAANPANKPAGEQAAGWGVPNGNGAAKITDPVK